MKGKEWYQADEVAQTYDSKRFSRGGQLIDDREKQAVLDALGPVDGRNILEIACGTGRFTIMLANRGANITAIDISAAMLAEGRKKAKQTGITEQIDWLRGDAARLPFPDNYFDAVFAMRFFHLADTPATFLTEMARVSNNVIFFDTFNERSTRVVYNWLLPMGSRLYSQTQVEQLLEQAGLSLIDSAHDFLLPYGFYRKIPNGLAQSFRDVDTTLGEHDFAEELASVSYWAAIVDTPATIVDQVNDTVTAND